MAWQIALGTLLILVSIGIGGTAFWAIETLFERAEGWGARGRHRLRFIALAMAAMLVAVAQMTLAVWIWALTFLGLGAFEALEPAVYFALVAFTTLGFGDILLPVEWRLLGGFAAANGLLNLGIMTAFLVEALRGVRNSQRRTREGR